MKFSFLLAFAALALCANTSQVHAQKSPEIGYVFPPGGKAGTTANVHLGGYDWTPDMELFVHHQRVQLTAAGPLGSLLIPPPPYWFGAKGRLASMPLPRELPAKFTLPADLPPGPILWQAANANGVTSAGVFIVGDGPEAVEDEQRKDAQTLPSLPITVSGRLAKNEEIDRYRFIALKDGPVTCSLTARGLGAKFLAILEVRDARGALVADVAATNGQDPALTFLAKAGTEYVVGLHDVDFGGDRSYVYRLNIYQGPRLVGAIPAAGKRGETRVVEFVGYGVATGTPKLESVRRQVTFPASGSAFNYRLETPAGSAAPFRLLLSDVPEISGLRDRDADFVPFPAGITTALDTPDVETRYLGNWKKGEIWSLSLEARAIGSPLDMSLAIRGPDGKEVARNDDLPGTNDAGLDFTVPADGKYQIMVSDTTGKSGTRANIYRLVGKKQTSDFSLHLTTQRVTVPLGEKFDLPVKVLRKGGFKGPINLTVRGLPAGVSVPATLQVPADKSDLVIPVTAAKDASPSGALITIEGAGQLESGPAVRTAIAPTTFNLAPRGLDDSQTATIMFASIMKPRFKGRPVDQDTGRKVHRGSTFPAEVIIERLDGFAGDVILQMAATQSYQVQGITGGEVKVPPGVKLAIYPCYMPEWLETTRTSRMGMIGMAQVPDPKGKVRYLANGMGGFITMTLEGALLKVAAEEPDLTVPAGQPFEVRLKVSRLAKLSEPAHLELRLPDGLVGKLKAAAVVVPVGKEEAVVRITPTADLTGLHTISIRGTALVDGRYPTISEAPITLEFRKGAAP